MKKFLDSFKQFGPAGAFVFFCLSSVVALAQEPQDAEIKNADLLLNHGKKKQAIEVLQKAIQTYPQVTSLYYYLGQAQIASGDRAGAKASFEKGAASNAKDQFCQVGLAQLLVLDKKAALAKPILDKAAGSAKKNVALLQAIARAQILDKSLSKDALPLLQKAKEVNANDPQTYLLLGDYYLGENQGGPSASAYEDAAALDGSSGMAHHKHATLFKRTKNMPVVEEDLKKAIAADPDYAMAHEDLAKLYYLKNDGKNAVKHQEIYMKLIDAPDDEDWFRLAFYYFSAKDYVKANAEFKKLSEKTNVTPMTLRFYTKSLTEAGQYPDAEKIFTRFMGTKADSVKAADYLIIGRLQQLQKNDSLWAISLEKAVSMDPTLQRPLEDLVAYYFKVRKYAPCAAACAKLNKVKKQPDANVYFIQGRSLFYIKQYQPADTSFAKVVELKPTFVSGYVWAARSKYNQDGNLEDKDAKVEWLAKPFYDRVVEFGEQDRENNKKDLSEAYMYIASYNAFKQDFPKAKEALKKILEFSPDDERAKEFLKSLDQPAPQQKKPRK